MDVATPDVATPDVGRDRVPPSVWDRSIKSPRLLTTFTGTIFNLFNLGGNTMRLSLGRP